MRRQQSAEFVVTHGVDTDAATLCELSDSEFLHDCAFVSNPNVLAADAGRSVSVIDPDCPIM